MARTQKQEKLDTRLLVDEFARVRSELKPLTKRYNELRDQILSLGQTTCEGTKCSAVLIERSRTGIDSAALKLEFGVKWYNSYCKTSNYYEIEIIDG